MSKQSPRKSFIQYELPPETLQKIQGGKPQVTTMAVGEEGCGPVTTKALGEEGGPIYTTLALGEEGGSYS